MNGQVGLGLELLITAPNAVAVGCHVVQSVNFPKKRIILIFGNIGKAALEEVQSAFERTRKYKEETPMKSCRELAKRFFNERDYFPLKAGAAMQELKASSYERQGVYGFTSVGMN